jgi:hypothetical protein
MTTRLGPYRFAKHSALKWKWKWKWKWNREGEGECGCHLMMINPGLRAELESSS